MKDKGLSRGSSGLSSSLARRECGDDAMADIRERDSEGRRGRDSGEPSIPGMRGGGGGPNFGSSRGGGGANCGEESDGRSSVLLDPRPGFEITGTDENGSRSSNGGGGGSGKDEVGFDGKKGGGSGDRFILGAWGMR